MSAEVNFYQYDDAAIRSIAPIVIKILDEKNKVLILCKDDKQAKELDTTLWSYGRNKFIPHSMESDKNFDSQRQPVLITTKAENTNQANYLIFLNPPKKEFVDQFSRAFYFYDQSNSEVSQNLAAVFSPKNIFRKENGKWIKS